MKAVFLIDVPEGHSLDKLTIDYKLYANGEQIELGQEYPIEVSDPEVRGSYECFHCGCDSVIWQSDFSFEDYGMEGEGIIHVCHCANCGADIEYYIRIGDEDE